MKGSRSHLAAEYRKIRLLIKRLGDLLREPTRNRSSRDKNQMVRVAAESMTVTAVSARDESQKKGLLSEQLKVVGTTVSKGG